MDVTTCVPAITISSSVSITYILVIFNYIAVFQRMMFRLSVDFLGQAVGLHEASSISQSNWINTVISAIS